MQTRILTVHVNGAAKPREAFLEGIERELARTGFRITPGTSYSLVVMHDPREPRAMLKRVVRPGRPGAAEKPST